MSNKRIFVEKRESFRGEAKNLLEELNTNLGLDIRRLRIFCVYDIFGISEKLFDIAKYRIFGDRATDYVTESIDSLLHEGNYIAVESLPGQFDQRAEAAKECLKLLDSSSEIEILTSGLYFFDDSLDNVTRTRISNYLINKVDSREKNLDILSFPPIPKAKDIRILTGFRKITKSEAIFFCKEQGLSMNADDLLEIVKYFRTQGRDPNETELKILDTYWSDHCRHITFNTILKDIKIEESFISKDLQESLEIWNDLRKKLKREDHPLCLMDLATIAARQLKAEGKLEDLVENDENNACSLYVDVDVDGKIEKWLFQFKNETHNHPTEIEPYGGASTCLGGAIRDPMSGRTFVYQAMRISGAGNIYGSIEETIEGKIPQQVISRKAAAGYSSYGNQIGIATTHVREIYHPAYVAKHLELGVVAGAVKAENVRNETPKPGDVVMMFGGRTGRDGIGGATGSSKSHDEKSIEKCGSEVQKGNAPEERKLARLFRRPEVTKLIKKSNDFGAGGISVAIGELADGIDIYLDRITTKYKGLDITELALSESQERMAVILDAGDMDLFMNYCHEENLEVRHVADVTESGRMRMFYNGIKVVDLRRDFINSSGAPHFANAKISSVYLKNPFRREIKGVDFHDKFLNNLLDPNVTSQRGLIEMFDSTIGASTVLMPFGGKTRNTETQVSIQKFPTGNKFTNTASMMTWGFDPFLSEWSPYHGAAYAMIHAIAKTTASGVDYRTLRFSFQEYFERMTTDSSWGKPLASLLGALRIQLETGLPAVGGKDSMSGSFKSINVPPTLIAFGVSATDSRHIISPELKSPGNRIFLLRHAPSENKMPKTSDLLESYSALYKAIKNKQIASAYAIGIGGVAEAIVKMSVGNNVGADITFDENEIFDSLYGAILFEATDDISFPGAEKIGYTLEEDSIRINNQYFSIPEVSEKLREKFIEIYPDSVTEISKKEVPDAECYIKSTSLSTNPIENPRVYIPVFPGTNCDYDMEKAFIREGAEITKSIFKNLTSEDIIASCQEMADCIDKCHILALSGGFSSADEPDGSGKFISNVLLNPIIRDSIEGLLKRNGLILGICNGFQALLKSGLLPYGTIGETYEDSPTLFRNEINRHISQIAITRVASLHSPWLSGFEIGQLHAVAMSHGEGRFMANEILLNELLNNGQIAFQYADPLTGKATMKSPDNPNGSLWAIEGIISPDGKILGKMGHSERYEEGLMKNIHGDLCQNIFRNAVNYFKGQ